MLRPPSALLACLVIAVAGTAGRADLILTATLTQDQEPPPTPTTTPRDELTGDPRPQASGTAMFVLNDARTTLTMTATRRPSGQANAGVLMNVISSMSGDDCRVTCCCPCWPR